MSRKHFLSMTLFICSYLLTFVPLAAQEEQGEKTKISERIVEEKQTHQDTTYQEPGTAFFLELGGKLFGSVNADFRINKSNRLSVGIMPSLMYYHLRGEKNNKFEIGFGFTIIPVSGEGGDFLHGVIGYRYQKKNGLLFRIGFTPIVIVSEWSFSPWFGISLGYSL